MSVNGCQSQGSTRPSFYPTLKLSPDAYHATMGRRTYTCNTLPLICGRCKKVRRWVHIIPPQCSPNTDHAYIECKNREY
ncbi:hypothetical protein DPMN_021757 [Dreissena polymorpha]|uniref:Uncharacterized protein n=1 Tax=Dreissena polymorpha TaxID=45954 RepID=A0A9D4S9G3_DREPO|nr:hypothetical protein DPMN_021757 [Dreissena polymorpha]